MNQTCNIFVQVALTAAVLIIATGCQSTGNTTQPTTQTNPAPVEPEISAAQNQPVPATPELKTVYFEYNRWELRDEARSALRGNAQQLQTNPEWNVVTVEGHCDDRGSEEYNLALGDRRAAAVKRYLVDLGVPASQVQTLSFGEGRPAIAGEGEDSWSRNRRAELSLGSRQASR
jgi:peptidoglycan-associated lipoprotein